MNRKTRIFLLITIFTLVLIIHASNSVGVYEQSMNTIECYPTYEDLSYTVCDVELD